MPAFKVKVEGPNVQGFDFAKLMEAIKVLLPVILGLLSDKPPLTSSPIGGATGNLEGVTVTCEQCED